MPRDGCSPAVFDFADAVAIEVGAEASLVRHGVHHQSHGQRGVRWAQQPCERFLPTFERSSVIKLPWKVTKSLVL